MVFLPLPGGYDVFDTSIFLIVEGDVQEEDAYVSTDRGLVEGVVDGDLVIAAGDLEINGVVTGDVLVASAGSVIVRGRVDGAVRGAARSVVVEAGGRVGDDLAVAAVTTELRGQVGRDVIVFGGSFDLSGSVGRDIHGRFVRGTIDGVIGRNVDVGTSSLEVGPAADVRGSLLYRSNRSADVADEASVGGQLERLSPRPSFFIDVWWTVATILGFFAFVFTGIVVLWLFRETGTNAVAAVIARPWRTIAMGLAALVLMPLVIVTLIASFVGVPLAVLLGVLYLLGFFFGPIPAVTAAAVRLPGGRRGLFAAFVIGAIVWRAAIFLLPFVAGALYALALVWGVGGWVSAVWDGRKAGYSEAASATTAST